MTRATVDIRNKARAANIPLWQIADALKVSEPTMTRKLRRELTIEEKTQIRAIIEQLRAVAS